MIKKSEIRKELYRSGEVAKMLGKTTRTIQNYCKMGKLDEVIVNSRRLIPKESVLQILEGTGLLLDDTGNKKDIIYARVSTYKQKQRGDLGRQIETIEKYVLYQNPINPEVIQDVGSGLNDNRKGIQKLIRMVLQKEVSRIFILYKDRLTRFGYNYIKAICEENGVEIVIVSNECVDKAISEELAEDIIAIIHSFSGKLYGIRRKLREDICKELCDDESSGTSCNNNESQIL